MLLLLSLIVQKSPTGFEIKASAQSSETVDHTTEAAGEHPHTIYE
jgi:branched-subunit amino acid ABC-type transport system permease component